MGSDFAQGQARIPERQRTFTELRVGAKRARHPPLGTSRNRNRGEASSREWHRWPRRTSGIGIREARPPRSQLASRRPFLARAHQSAEEDKRAFAGPAHYRRREKTLAGARL